MTATNDAVFSTAPLANERRRPIWVSTAPRRGSNALPVVCNVYDRRYLPASRVEALEVLRKCLPSYRITLSPLCQNVVHEIHTVTSGYLRNAEIGEQSREPTVRFCHQIVYDDNVFVDLPAMMHVKGCVLRVSIATIEHIQ